MKKQMKNYLAAIMAAIIVTTGGAAMANADPHGAHNSQAMAQGTNLAKYMSEQDAIMADMMKAMKNVPKSGNPSVDFLKGMIPHHQAAILMSESLLRYGGQNQALKQLAEDIIRVQKTEITQMQEMAGALKTAKADQAKEAAYLKEYNKMFDGTMSHAMPHGAATAQSVDAAFTEGMIMHHEMAVDMSKAILDYTEDAKVKALAQEIIDAQVKEIAQMKEMLRGMQ